MSPLANPFRFRHFVPPPEATYREWDGEYLDGHATYASYNYLGGGPVARIKAAHFEAALGLASDGFGRSPVIDFGSADGVLLPSLARHFPRVTAIDIDPGHLAVAQRVVDDLDLTTVELICNRDISMETLAERLRPGGFEILFLLETLEHVGDASRLYESKMEFLDDLFALLAPGGRIVISVPNMVGIPFALQRAGLAALRLQREPLSKADLFRAAVLRKTDALEPDWVSYKHLGFNHLKLERHMRERFRVTGRRRLFFSQVYAIERS